MRLKHDARAVARQFQMGGEFQGAELCGHGHVNDTYQVAFRRNGADVRYALQRINEKVFKDPVALMRNIERVTVHLGTKVGHKPDRARRALSLVPTREGGAWHRDGEGNYWRAYWFIEKARACDAIESPRQAFEAARAFGEFQRFMADLPPPRLHDTIPDFHHTPKRFHALEIAIEADAFNRAARVKEEIQFALRRKAMTGALIAANLPERVSHNDAKLSNVMLDEATGEGICVIDLDTVMPGLALYDFGDMVRASTSSSAEDERDLSRVTMQFPMFEALARGYLASVRDFLTASEKRHLALAGKLITFEIGIRFLADHLAGDIYFKVHREGHNLDRCRTQFKLVESIEQQEDKMNRLVESLI